MVCLHSEGLVTLFLHLRHCFVNCFPDITCFIILNCVTNILGSGQFIFGSHVCIHDVLRLRYSDWCLRKGKRWLKDPKVCQIIVCQLAILSFNRQVKLYSCHSQADLTHSVRKPGRVVTPFASNCFRCWETSSRYFSAKHWVCQTSFPWHVLSAMDFKIWEK